MADDIVKKTTEMYVMVNSSKFYSSPVWTDGLN